MPSPDHSSNGILTRQELRNEIAQGAVALEDSRTELRDQTRILKSVFDSMAEGVLVVDCDGKQVISNRAAERIIGIGARDVPLEDWSEVYGIYLPDKMTLCPPDDLAVVRAIRGEFVDATELFVRNHGDSEGTWISVSARPLRDDDGNVQGGVVVIRDMSKQKQAQEALAEKQSELERSNHDLEQFAYAASHDLQEPLRAVSGYCQLLARRFQGQLGPQADNYITEAVNGARRMQALIEGLLAYSRVSRRGNPRVLTESQSAFDHCLMNLRTAIEESGATITHGPLPTVFADPMQLMLLFQNLIGNALKYRGEYSPEIHVSARDEDKEWLFAVHDNGIGIDPKFYERIFLIFQRLHTRREYAGTGIGLAICKRIVECHGGRIWVESAPGQGSTFYFTLPRNEESIAGAAITLD